MKKAIAAILDAFRKPKSPGQSTSSVNKADRNYQGVSRPSPISPQENSPQTSTNSSKHTFTGQDVWTIAGNVQIIRERKGLTQLQLAERLGYKSASFVSRLELWEIDKLNHDQVLKLAECLGVSVDKLLHKNK